MPGRLRKRLNGSVMESGSIEPGELLWPNSKGKHLGLIGPILVVGVSTPPRRYDVMHRGELLNWSARQLENHTKLSENVP